MVATHGSWLLLVVDFFTQFFHYNSHLYFMSLFFIWTMQFFHDTFRILPLHFTYFLESDYLITKSGVIDPTLRDYFRL